jgi:hypothetical protein
VGALRTIYRYWLLVMLAAVVLQIAFAGYGAFAVYDAAGAGEIQTEDDFFERFTLHAILGLLLVLAGLILFLLALGARAGKQRVLHSLGIFGLLVVQMLLGWFGTAAPFLFGALHPVNAVVIFGAIGYLAYREWRGDRVEDRLSRAVG